MNPLDLSNLPINNIDYFLCESTLLSRKISVNLDSQNYLSDFQLLISNVIRRSGLCVILTSAVGIAQELMIALIKENASKVAKIGIYLDKSIYEITNLYLNKNKWFSSELKNNVSIHRVEEFFTGQQKIHGYFLNVFFVTPQTFIKNSQLRTLILLKPENMVIASYSPTELSVDKDKNGDLVQHLKTLLKFDESSVCELHHCPCFMHADYSGIKKTIMHLKPKFVYFMHGKVHSRDLVKLSEELKACLANFASPFFIPMENLTLYGGNKHEIK